MMPPDATQPASVPDRQVRTWVSTSPADMDVIYDVRREVFVEEQRLTSTVRDDPDDRYGTHVLAAVDDTVVGVSRVTFVGDEAQIAWVAVRKPYRQMGVGRAMMERLLEVSHAQGCRTVTLNAQTHALGFYELLGFEPVGRRFYMSNIEHQFMVLRLAEDEPAQRGA